MAKKNQQYWPRIDQFQQRAARFGSHASKYCCDLFSLIFDLCLQIHDCTCAYCIPDKRDSALPHFSLQC
jgi:hypothetical protein